MSLIKNDNCWVKDLALGIWRFQMQCGCNGGGYYIAQSNWVNIR